MDEISTPNPKTPARTESLSGPEPATTTESAPAAPPGSAGATPPGEPAAESDSEAPTAERAAGPVDSPVAAPRGRRRFVPWIAVAIVGVLAGSALFVSGYTLGRQTALTAGTPAELQQAFEPFWDAYNAIEQRFAGGTVDRHALIEGAIGGMFSALGDPYSSYMSAEQFRNSLSGVSGQFEGIGAVMATRDPKGVEGCSPIGPACALTVDHPIPGSPAQRAGLQPGDVVTRVNGDPVAGKTVDQVVQLVRGKRGTPVTLTLVRGGKAPFDLTIVRDVISVEEVTSKLLADGQVGYLRIDGFGATSADAFRSHLADLLQRDHVSKLILDVRNDPGGFVDQARLIASQFVDAGPILWQESADGTKTEQPAAPGGLATDRSIQVAVLIDHGSASASEILAGALQDSSRATLVGQQSFGKGTMQEWQALSADSGGFRLTVAKWLTPKQRWINKLGLTPDIAVPTSASAAPGADPILDRAVAFLTGAAALAPSGS